VTGRACCAHAAVAAVLALQVHSSAVCTSHACLCAAVCFQRNARVYCVHAYGNSERALVIARLKFEKQLAMRGVGVEVK
jgi:hypothetical protein